MSEDPPTTTPATTSAEAVPTEPTAASADAAAASPPEASPPPVPADAASTAPSNRLPRRIGADEHGRTSRTELRGRHRVLYRRHREHDADHRPGEEQRPAVLRRRPEEPDREGQERRPVAGAVLAFRDFTADGQRPCRSRPSTRCRPTAQASRTSSTDCLPRVAGMRPNPGWRPLP